MVSSSTFRSTRRSSPPPPRHLQSHLRELVSAAPPSSSTPARPRHPPGPHRASSLRRIPSPPPHPSPPSVADRFPPGLIVEPRPAAVELSSTASRRRCLARPHDLAVSESYASREVLSLAPWPASTPCPARHPPQLVFR